MLALQSPFLRQRWRIFRANRRGFYALILFIILVLLSCCSRFIANDRPLLVHFDDRFYVPVFQTVPETMYGGFFETEADYTDPFVLDAIEAKGWLIWPPIRYRYNTPSLDLSGSAPTPPDRHHLLGTDDESRDVLARLIYSFRNSVLAGLVLAFASALIGILAGMIQGYYGGWIDLLAQRVVEIWNGMPVLFLLLILASLIRPNLFWLLALLLLFSWTSLVGVVRAEVLRTRKQAYILAARALGLGDLAIQWRHILPNAMVASLTFLPFLASNSVITITSLDFLGFGLPPGEASLGEMLKQAKENLDAPWLGASVVTVLAGILVMLVFIGEALRDAFDPGK